MTLLAGALVLRVGPLAAQDGATGPVHPPAVAGGPRPLRVAAGGDDPKPGPREPVPVDEGAVRVGWSGADADGDPLVYTVLYSANGGETWMDVAFETLETSVLVPVDPEAPADAHRILVRATDGGRSSDALQTLHPVFGGS